MKLMPLIFFKKFWVVVCNLVLVFFFFLFGSFHSTCLSRKRERKGTNPSWWESRKMRAVLMFTNITARHGEKGAEWLFSLGKHFVDNSQPANYLDDVFPLSLSLKKRTILSQRIAF